MSLEKFKTEVMKHRCLYDRTSMKFKDKALKTRTWMEVARNMTRANWEDMTAEQKKAKVQSLRNKWNTLDRKLKNAKTTDSEDTPKKQNTLQQFMMRSTKVASEKKEETMTTVDAEEEDRKLLLSLLPDYKLLKKCDKMKINSKISKWIEECISSYDVSQTENV